MPQKGCKDSVTMRGLINKQHEGPVPIHTDQQFNSSVCQPAHQEAQASVSGCTCQILCVPCDIDSARAHLLPSPFGRGTC